MRCVLSQLSANQNFCTVAFDFFKKFKFSIFCYLGRVKTPKSILLPSILKTLTNNTEIINMVNRLGHGISYTLLMEIQTENAYMIVDQQMQSGCLLPINCQKEVFTIYVADNIDRKEETLSGKYWFDFR